MIGGKKIEAKDGIAIGGDVENSLLVNGDVAIFNLTQAQAEAMTLRAEAEPRRLDWEHTEARYDTFGVLASGRSGEEIATHAALIDWLQDADAPPVFALLGEYGMGKTLECQRLYSFLRDRYAQGDAVSWMPRPIYFDLRKSPQFRDADRSGKMPLPSAREMVERLIERDWVHADGARRPSYDEIEAQLADGGLLIVDGLDECLVHLVNEQHGDFLSIWVDMVWDAAKRAHRAGRRLPRLLVSCRTELFKNILGQSSTFIAFERMDIKPSHIGKAACREFVLHPLTKDRIDTYLREVCPDLYQHEVRQLVETTHNLAELSRRPITLKFIAGQMPKLLRLRQRVGRLNAATLYGQVVEDALSKQGGRHHLDPAYKRVLLAALAAHLWRSGVRTLNHDALHRWLHDWLEDLYRNDSKAKDEYRGMKFELIEKDLRTATLIVRPRASGGNSESEVADEKDEEEGFGFAHSSFAEYFLAVYLADAVRADRPEDWAISIPSKETLDFLIQRLELDQSSLPKKLREAGGLPAVLTRWAKTYRPQASELLLKYALHARGGKVQMPVLPSLRGADFSCAQLRGWRFGERFQDKTTPLLDMVGIRWTDADLRETNFAHVCLDDGDLSGARLDVATFQHCSAQRCNWRNGDLLGTVFRHCRLDGGHWVPLRQCHRPKLVACTGADFLTIACHPPEAMVGGPSGTTDAAIAELPLDSTGPSLSGLPPRLRAAFASLLGDVLSVGINADGRFVVSGSDKGIVCVWDAASGESMRVLRGHESAVLSVAMSMDGGRVVSGSRDGIVRVWDVATGGCVSQLRVHTNWVLSIGISADGRLVVSGSDEGIVRVWDAASGECLRQLRGHTNWVQSVAMSADGSRVVSGSDDRTLRVWDAGSGECVCELRVHGSGVRSVAMSANCGRVASGSYDGIVRVWDVLSGECVRELCGHKDRLTSVAMSADGGCVVSRSYDGIVRVWDALSGECVRELCSWSPSVAMSADGGRVVSHSYDGVACVLNAISGECLRELRGVRFDVDSVTSLAMSADNERMVSGSYSGTVRVLDAASGESIRELHGHESAVLSVAMSADGGRVISASLDGIVRVCDVASGACVRELDLHESTALIVLMSGSGARVVSSSYNGIVRVWDAVSGECIRELSGHEHRLTSVAMSADGGHIVSGADDGTLRVWDTASGACVRELAGHKDRVQSVAMSADGKRMVSGATNGTLGVWDVASGKCVSKLRAHAAAVMSVAMSEGGDFVVSASHDHTVRMWYPVIGACLHELRGHTDCVLSVAMSTDRGRVVSGSCDGTMRCYAVVGGRGAAMDHELQCRWIAASGLAEGIPSHASWRLGQRDESDTLVSASGDAWRFLSWDVADPAEPGGWRRVPLQAYE